MDSKNNSSLPAAPAKSFASLKGHLLIAMPVMDDPRFEKCVIFIAAHDEKGAMGLVINHPLEEPSFAGILSQLGIIQSRPLDPALALLDVYAGGPVESGHGFLLHSADFAKEDTIHIDDLFSISGTLDSLRAIVSGYRPDKMLFALGYAGWTKGQLEQEIQDNVWLTVPASHEIVFNTNPDHMWENAFAIIGVNPAMMSASAGRA